MTAIIAHWTFQSPFIDAWTGLGGLSHGGVDYSGVGDLVQIEPLTVDVGEPERRAAITISAVDPALRGIFLTDPGPVKITLQQIYSTDGGSTWLSVPRTFRGRMSAPVLAGGKYRFEVAKRIVDIDRQGNLFWSDLAQRCRASDDLGFEHARALADGLDIRWPP